MTIKEITFTADILRPFLLDNHWESATYKNVEWLSHLIGWQIKKATNLPSKSVSWRPNDFNAEAVYEALKLPLNYDSWAALFYSDSLPHQVDQLLVQSFQDTIVVGVEIPDVLQLALSRHEIPFIDIISHPVRFMEDLLFGFRTNNVLIHKKLVQYQINVDDYCLPRANLLKAKVAWMPSMSLPAGTALITGQVATDKALISRQHKRFESLLDYHDQLQTLAKKHPMILFKPHPYQGPDCPSRQAIESLGVAKEVKQNYYYLVSQQGVSDVYAINSGTVTEAGYFNRQGHMLGDSLYHFGTRPPSAGYPGDAIPIDAAFLEPTFWAEVLAPLTPVQSQLPAGPSPRPSLLRRSLNADWDYGYIDEVVQRDVCLTD